MAQTSEKSNGNDSRAAEDAREDLSRQLEAVKADIARLTQTLGDLSRSERDRIFASARARGEEMRSAGEAQYVRAKDSAEGYIREGERYVREQPGTALGLAAAMGFLVGFLMSSRR